jgi:hypothetical protein
LDQGSGLLKPTFTKFSLEALQARAADTSGCDKTRLLEYLSDADFQKTFGMTLADFAKMPSDSSQEAASSLLKRSGMRTSNAICAALAGLRRARLHCSTMLPCGREEREKYALLRSLVDVVQN